MMSKADIKNLLKDKKLCKVWEKTTIVYRSKESCFVNDCLFEIVYLKPCNLIKVYRVTYFNHLFSPCSAGKRRKLIYENNHKIKEIYGD